MPCDEIQELLSADLDGEASPEEVNRLKAHLADCRDCLGFQASLRDHKAALRRTPLPSIPDDLRQSLLAEARKLDRPSFFSRRFWSNIVALPKAPAWRFGFAAAALLLAVAATERVFIPAEEAIPVDMLLAEHGRYADALSSAQEDHEKP